MVMNKTECFKIRIEILDDPLKIGYGRELKKINCSKEFCVTEPTAIVADPFLFVQGDTLFLFYEEKKMYHDGVISMIKTTDLENWTAPVVVLKEKCHLSYPWIFEDSGHTYMIPETSGLKSIRVYEGNNNLSEFHYVKTILKDDEERGGFSFSDTLIYKYNDTYYLITTVNDGKKNILRLFESKKIFEGYSEHPCSPIYNNNKYGRNAGLIFTYNKKIYRVAQDCMNRYGDNVHMLEIYRITPDAFEEKSFREYIIPTQERFYREGGHQFNCVRFKNKYIVATDAKEYHYYIFPKILHKLGSF